MTSHAAVQRWLDTYCDRSGQVAGGVVLATGGDGETRTAAEWPAACPLRSPLIAAARAAARQARPVEMVPVLAGQEGQGARVISLPLRAGERSVGAVALAVRAADPETAGGVLRDLERAGASLAAALGAAAPAPRTIEPIALLRLQSALMASTPLADAAAVFASDLATTLGCDRVCVGLIEGGRVEVAALSHGTQPDGRQELVRAIAAAMEEAIDQSAAVVFPAEPEGPLQIVRAHAELAGRAGTAILTVPLIADARAVGALCFERSGTTPPDPSEVALCENLAGIVAPLLELRRRAERPWRDRFARLLQAGTSRTRLLAAAGTGALLLLAFLPVTHQVGAPARVEGSIQRVLAAPTDGFLRQVHVRPGDAVREGDLLVELADQDLVLERRKWESELAQHENSYSAAMARADRTQFAISQARAAEARARLDLVLQQLARTRIVAPMDGLVTQGDLTQSLGSPVQRGQVLLTLAPQDGFRLIVEVDERDIAAVAQGQRGHLALSALPGDTLSFGVARITPVATVTADGRNAFEVEAALDQDGALLRPGLQGFAKIDAGTAPLAWVWTHRLFDWIRLQLWTWFA